tara:strand:- start:608 stop:3061 length:2454 start_codon:yes stop_codon:yes gene_type:complete
MASFHYQLGTFTKEQYDALDASLRDPDDPTYVAREVSQTDGILHSPTRGVFWLSEEEAAELEKDPQIEFLHKDPDRNPEDFPQPPAEDMIMVVEQSYRYNEPVKHRNSYTSTSSFPTSPDATDLRRCGYQLLRTTRENGPKAKRDIWASDTTTTTANIKKYGTGKDVDCVIVDNGTWIGHIEFINNRPASESPQDYVGGNVLPGNGICDCLDMILDSPYYIDPDWFNAAPASRLKTRWDGTTIPTEAEAKSWWSNTSNRSAAFASYGTVTISNNYSRLNCNGDYNSSPYEINGIHHSTHGTQCGSQVYGRTHGWAYNSNKWVIDAFSSKGVGLSKVWDIQKIFHQAKPVNPKYGTKDPTISSNSWGYRTSPPSSGYTFHRSSHGGTGVAYSTHNTRQRFCRYVGNYGDSGTRMKSEMRPNSMVTSAKECVEAGVLVVTAAGNGNQKQVHWDHPDYDNYWHSGSTGHFGDGIVTFNGGYQVNPTTNRPGFPQNVGATFGDPQSYTIQVTAGSGVYTMTGTDRLGSVSGDNPTITINRGDTINFVVNASGHPFYIKTSAGGIGTGDTVQYPTATGNGTESGTVIWSPNQRTPSSLSGASFKYICQYHSSMVGTITVRTGNVTKPTINIGALDDQYATGTKERKVTYSDMGNAIDCYSPADGSIAATPLSSSGDGYGTDVPRYDNTYSSPYNDTNWSDGTTGTADESRDTRFSGTSAACPNAAGLIATVVEFNRNWSHTDIKTWLATLQNQDTTNDFYDGAEDTGADDIGHSDVNKLQGSTPRVLYQGGTYSHTTKETTSKELKMSSSISITGSIGLSRE